LNGESGEFLQGVEGLAAATDERVQIAADDGHDGAVVLDVEIDVAVVVDDVQQSLEVVRRDVALPDEQALARGRVLGGVVLGGVVLGGVVPVAASSVALSSVAAASVALSSVEAALVSTSVSLTCRCPLGQRP
jgi:hypothetical protein